MSIFDKLKSTAQQAATSAIQSIGNKREKFTLLLCPRALPKCRRSPRRALTHRLRRRL